MAQPVGCSVQAWAHGVAASMHDGTWTESCFSSCLKHEGETLTVRIATNPVAGFGFKVWNAAKALCCYMELRERALGRDMGAPLCKGQRVLELGAGPGLVGVLAAHLGAEVTLTDMLGALPVAHHNVSLNPPPERCSGKMRVEELRWGQDVRNNFRRDEFDVILGSDVTYAEYLHGPFMATLLQLISEHTEVVLSHQWRVSDAFGLWQMRFRRYVEVQTVATPDEVRSYAGFGLDVPDDMAIGIYRLKWVGPPPFEEDVAELLAGLDGRDRAGEQLLERLLLRMEDLEHEDYEDHEDDEDYFVGKSVASLTNGNDGARGSACR